MAKQPESRLQKSIRSAIQSVWPDCFIFKVHGGKFQRAGVPDLLACIDGHFIALEVKLPGKEHTLSKIQEQVISKILAAGGAATMVTSVEEALEYIRDIVG